MPGPASDWTISGPFAPTQEPQETSHTPDDPKGVGGFVDLNLWAFHLNWFDSCQIMLRYWLQCGEKSRSGGILGGLGDLSEAMLKMACLGSCWSYVGTSLAAGWLPRSSFRRFRMPRWAKMAPKRLPNWVKMASWARNSKLLLQFWCHFIAF